MKNHFKVVAKNRHGHMTVFATQSPGIIPLIALCFHAAWFYKWINLTITKID